MQCTRGCCTHLHFRCFDSILRRPQGRQCPYVGCGGELQVIRRWEDGHSGPDRKIFERPQDPNPEPTPPAQVTAVQAEPALAVRGGAPLAGAATASTTPAPRASGKTCAGAEAVPGIHKSSCPASPTAGNAPTAMAPQSPRQEAFKVLDPHVNEEAEDKDVLQHPTADTSIVASAAAMASSALGMPSAATTAVEEQSAAPTDTAGRRMWTLAPREVPPPATPTVAAALAGAGCAVERMTSTATYPPPVAASSSAAAAGPAPLRGSPRPGPSDSGFTALFTTRDDAWQVPASLWPLTPKGHWAPWPLGGPQEQASAAAVASIEAPDVAAVLVTHTPATKAPPSCSSTADDDDAAPAPTKPLTSSSPCGDSSDGGNNSSRAEAPPPPLPPAEGWKISMCGTSASSAPSAGDASAVGATASKETPRATSVVRPEQSTLRAGAPIFVPSSQSQGGMLVPSSGTVKAPALVLTPPAAPELVLPHHPATRKPLIGKKRAHGTPGDVVARARSSAHRQNGEAPRPAATSPSQPPTTAIVAPAPAPQAVLLREAAVALAPPVGTMGIPKSGESAVAATTSAARAATVARAATAARAQALAAETVVKTEVKVAAAEALRAEALAQVDANIVADKPMAAAAEMRDDRPSPSHSCVSPVLVQTVEAVATSSHQAPASWQEPAPRRPAVPEDASTTMEGASAAAAPTVVAPPPSRQVPPLGSSLDVPTRAHAAQLMDPDLHAEFVCRICLELCEPTETSLLPCSHIFCRDCLHSYLEWLTGRPQYDCPVCRKPFTREQAGISGSSASTAISQWVSRLRVRCVFAAPADLCDDDPLPEGHTARVLGLRCGWVGTVSAYTEHLREGCQVAARLQELRCRQQAEPSAMAQTTTKTYALTTSPPPPPPPPATTLTAASSRRSVARGIAEATRHPAAGISGAATQAPPPPPPRRSPARGADVSSSSSTHVADTERRSGAAARDAAAARGAVGGDADIAAGSGIRAAADAARSGFVAGGSGDWCTGEFAVLALWRSAERWGAEAALSVRAGDHIYISEVDAQGWARGTLQNGQSGWLPFAICERRIFTAAVPIDGDEAAGYCRIGLHDHLVVYHREGEDWIYGARLPRAGVDGARGWFSAHAVAAASR